MYNKINKKVRCVFQVKLAIEENRGEEGIGGSLFSQDTEGRVHCRGGIWANSCKKPRVRASEKAWVRKSLVCLGTASNQSDRDSEPEGKSGQRSE